MTINEQENKTHVYSKTTTQPNGKGYFILTISSFLTIDLKSTIKSIPFVLLVISILFVLAMEMYGAIDGGIRLPEYFATTALMMNTILATLPALLRLAILFYGIELVWKSKSVNFSSIESCAPFSKAALFISKFITVLSISILLVFSSIILGVLFQVLYKYPIVDITAYVSLFYYISLPASL